MNATREANTEEHKTTLETSKANPAPASNCPVGAISESCATMLVTQNMPTSITAIKMLAVKLPNGAISTEYLLCYCTEETEEEDLYWLATELFNDRTKS